MDGKQLVLDVRLSNAHHFESFLGEPGSLLLTLLQQMADGDVAAERQIFLHGPAGSGKTHLLQALCHRARNELGACAYLPLAQLMPENPAHILEGFERLELVCIDEVECLSSSPSWEQAVFVLVNALRERRSRLVLAARAAPEGLGIGLRDLVSRLSWGPVFRMDPPDDVLLREILLRRASARGLHLDARVCDYLLHHETRDAATLMDLLDHLDLASLERQRRLTLPFVREQMQVFLEKRASVAISS